jgi:RNA polymerase sigma-70 factor (ECF subfamily)
MKNNDTLKGGHTVVDLKALAKIDRRLAIIQLIKRHQSLLHRSAMCIVKDRDTAWDVVQETFVKAMNEPRLFAEDFHTKAWLFMVTRNRCFNVVRDRNRRARLLEDRKAEVLPQGFSRMSAVTNIENRRLREGLHHAMSGVSPIHREVLDLHYFEQLSYVEIAQRLNVKLGTVMSRLSRARAAMRAIFGPQEVLLLSLA